MTMSVRSTDAPRYTQAMPATNSTTPMTTASAFERGARWTRATSGSTGSPSTASASSSGAPESRERRISSEFAAVDSGGADAAVVRPRTSSSSGGGTTQPRIETGVGQVDRRVHQHVDHRDGDDGALQKGDVL